MVGRLFQSKKDWQEEGPFLVVVLFCYGLLLLSLSSALLKPSLSFNKYNQVSRSGSAMEMIRNFTAQQICSYHDLDKKVQSLRIKFEELSCQAADINAELEDAELRSGKKRKRVVENWLENVELKRNKVQSIVQEAQERNITSLISLGNRIDKLIGEVTDLSKRGRFTGGLLLDVRETRGEPLLTTKLIGQTFQQNLEKIWAILMDDEVLCIGIYGMGGVGKTTLVSHIHNGLLEKSEMFGHICWITVSEDFSIRKLQDDIAKTLNLNFSNEDDEKKRAAELSKALTRREKCVLILDDVWNQIPLDRVGIANRLNGHKLVLTTRSFDVCRKMDCQANIKVESLSKEEAWNLFIEKFGHCTTLSPEVRNIAMSVVAKCAGLPLGIITMAASMRGVNDIHEWRNVLNELQELTMGQEDMEDQVFPILKYSYSRLNDLKLQHCFLYCACYPEDYKIERNELIEYFIAEGLIKERNRQAMFDKGHTMLNKLERVCLLESCRAGRCVKMHDLIRDMALKITKESHPRFMVKASSGLWKIPDEQEWTEDLEKVSLMKNDILEIGCGLSPRCPRISTLILKGNSLYRIAGSFFKHLHALNVLNLSDTRIRMLPNSISDLENLTALLLGRCSSLTYVPPLGKLSALRELDLSRTAIKEIPQGVDRLVNLTNLNIGRTRSLKTIPKGTLCRLSHLQCLRFPCEVGSVEALAEDLDGLRELEEFEVQLNVICGFNRFVKSLQRCGMRANKYSLVLGYPELESLNSEIYHNLDNDTRVVKFGKCDIGSGGILLPYDLEILDIEECNFSRSRCLCDVFPSSCSNTRDLKACAISECQGLESIFSLPSSSLSSHNNKEEETEEAYDEGVSHRRFPFQSLERLSLYNLPNLRALFKLRELEWFGVVIAPPPCGTFSSLRELRISYCPQINNLFTPRLLLQHLQNLEMITVEWCIQMKEIVTIDEGGMGRTSLCSSNDHDHDNTPMVITLPKLKILSLYDLPDMKSIWEGIMVWDSIEVIRVKRCPNLKRPFPFSLPLVNGQPSAPTALKQIEICNKDREWWESLEWDHSNAKDVLLPFLCFAKY